MAAKSRQYGAPIFTVSSSTSSSQPLFQCHSDCAALQARLISQDPALPSPASSMTRRSRPKAMPPWGGAPHCSASSSAPNLPRASDSDNPIAANTRSCTSRR